MAMVQPVCLGRVSWPLLVIVFIAAFALSGCDADGVHTGAVADGGGPDGGATGGDVRPTPDGAGAAPAAASLFVRIEPGTYRMGSPYDEPGHQADEDELEVRIERPFLLGATEVTRTRWAEVMDGDQPTTRPDLDCPDCPVDGVSWFDAIAYANALSDREGLAPCYALSGCRGTPGGGCPNGEYTCDGDFSCDDVRFEGLDCAGYRLPTEAEWEYAARAGTRTAFATGRCLDVTQANVDGRLPYADCPITPIRDALPLPVASFPPNPWGLYDMEGNVWEWVWDPFEAGAERAFDDDSYAATRDRERCVRGGGWSMGPADARSARRSSAPPYQRYDNDGFRIARTVQP